MKAIVFSLAILISSSVFAQEAPKGSNTIIVKGATYEQVIGALQDHGYWINFTNRDAQSMAADNPSTNLVIRAWIRNGSAYVQGSSSGLLVESSFKKFFTDLQKFAESLGKDISYTKL